jgi:hypothetical protein
VKAEELERTLKNVNSKHENEIQDIRVSSNNLVDSIRTKARKLLEDRDEVLINNFNNNSKLIN